MDAVVRRTVRRAVVALTPAVLVGTGSVVALTTLAARLPERAYGTGGYRDSMPWSVVLVLAVVWCLVIVVAGGGALYTRRVVPTSQRWVGPSAWIAAVLGGGTILQLVLRNLDLADPPARPDLWWTAAPVVVPALLVLTALAWWAMGPDPLAPDAVAGPGPDAPRLRLAAGERALWTRSVVSRRGIGWACFWALMTAVAALGANGYIPETIFALTAVTSAVQSWVRVRVDEHGVRVIQPLLGRALIGVDLRHVVEAGARTLDNGVLPSGKYGVIHTARMSAFRVTAGGETLRLEMSDGREFVVTVPDAATAAALVNTQLDRRRAAADGSRC
jgi:hypothetical protein